MAETPRPPAVGLRSLEALPIIAVLAVAAAVPIRATGQESGQEARARTRELVSGTTALLQAVSAAGPEVVWVSGHAGVVLRSTDGGATWERRPVQTGDSLQFRDVHAFDADRAVILSAGEGTDSRIYRTSDGGRTWSLGWRNEEPAGFYDCLDFWDDRRGIAYGDAVGGELRILRTDDAGASWRLVAGNDAPPALEGEGGFAASGTCVRTGPGGRAWIVTGAGPVSRVLRTDDYGESWSAYELPIVAGSAAGAFTVVFHDRDSGIVLGGDLGAPEGFADNVALTRDGGSTWRLAERPPFPGAVYGSSALGDAASERVIAAGPGGLAVRAADGWSLIDDRSYWAVGAVGAHAWAVGPEGRILEVSVGSGP